MKHYQNITDFLTDHEFTADAAREVFSKYLIYGTRQEIQFSELAGHTVESFVVLMKKRGWIID